MRIANKTAVVGQGPNQECWKSALAKAEKFQSTNVYAWAYDYTARLAITGRVGERLAELAGLDRLDFYRSVGRFNEELRRLGYSRIETGLWNNRPAYWRRTTL